MSPVKTSTSTVTPSRTEWVDYGRDVIVTEASALSDLANSLDESFAAAVSLILSAAGRVVLTGMGKSGHVARKTASTFASIGVPAHFVHPAEAAHGDLGMLVSGDLLIALSNSGFTRELVPVMQHARAIGIAMIAITSQAQSPLANGSDACLLLPAVDEACPSNLAPTTSTAMMMALGDALAMATMRVRGLSRAGFGALHPGGKIGSRLVRVTAMMHLGADLPLVDRATPMREVIVTMTTISLGIAGVIDAEGRLVGVITDGDLRRNVDSLLISTACEVMTPSPITVSASCLAEEALALMNRYKITAVFVTDDADRDRPIGIVHIHDFLRFGLK